jgi:hypothetical protein
MFWLNHEAILPKIAKKGHFIFENLKKWSKRQISTFNCEV